MSETVRPSGKFEYPSYDFVPPSELTGGKAGRHRVVIVGGGIAGLTAAADLGSRGIDCILLDDNNTVSAGSRSIGQAKRSLEIWDRIGCADRMQAAGQAWSVGNILCGDEHLLSFDLSYEKKQKFPPFLTLPQYYVESFLVDRCRDFPGVEIRWLNRVKNASQTGDLVTLEVETPDGDYSLESEWVIAADGVRSNMREYLNLPFEGGSFEDRFVIADVKVLFGFPPQRMFWFDPPFIDSPIFLLHQQREGIWRVDWQLGPDDDSESEIEPGNANRKLAQILGKDVEFDIQNISVYRFGARRIPKFRVGRVLFASDAAHQLSPFGGGRGGNSGVQDIDNLVWKLAMVLDGSAPDDFLESYDRERIPVADENIELSNSGAEFITPTSRTSKALRQAVLTLAPAAGFARAFINTGRMSITASLRSSPLVTPDRDKFAGKLVPGDAPVEAPLHDANGTETWFVQQFTGHFTLMLYGDPAAEATQSDLTHLAKLGEDPIPVRTVPVAPLTSIASGSGGFTDHTGQLAEIYDLAPGSCYLFRPDQHIVARWRRFDIEAVRQAIGRSTGQV
jgi:3-(3-hydroxy-phenyl)propionate hydroxylase